MNYLRYIFLLLIVLLPIQVLKASDGRDTLDRFLLKKLHVENEDLHLVSSKLLPFFELVPNPLLEDFLLLIDQMTPVPGFQQILRDLEKNDAVIAAPEAHQVVYENDFVRILESSLKPGQIVPFHTHQWDSIILTIQGSQFTCNDGYNVIEEDWPPMVEKVQGSSHAHSFQNVGITEFRALAFEFKK